MGFALDLTEGLPTPDPLARPHFFKIRGSTHVVKLQKSVTLNPGYAYERTPEMRLCSVQIEP